MTEIGIAVPSLNQGRFLDAALESLRRVNGVRLHVAVLDGGSSDDSVSVIDRHRDFIEFSRSGPDAGQAAAVNEGLAWLMGKFPSIAAVGWLNADDTIIEDGLADLATSLTQHPEWLAVTARAWVLSDGGEVVGEYPSAPFSREGFARACTFSQPATLVRRAAWEDAGGLDTSFDMSFDYDLWWRLADCGPIGYLDRIVAGTRDHGATKTRTRRRDYFLESIRIVSRETGRVGWHWCISEALEREAGWQANPRLGLPGRLRAASRALVSYVGRNRLGWKH